MLRLIPHQARFAAASLLVFLCQCGLAVGDTATGNRVTINTDNVLVINGRKVFPIGFTLAPRPDGLTPEGKNGLQELADAGATFMRTGANGSNWTEETIAMETRWEDAAAQHGLYCWLFLRELADLQPDDSKKEAFLRKVVEKFKDHPGLGLWKGADEPEWGKRKVPPLVHARDIVRELDTNHPLNIMQAPRGTVQTLRPYNAACDITGADVYPISYPPGIHSLLTNKDLNMVGDYTRTMMETADGKMPVWMVLQIAWSGVAKPGKTLRFPTFFEERFMTYEAIINGARGLVYFGGNIPQTLSPEDAKLGWNWTFWKRVLRPVMEEIGTKSPLAPALVAPDSHLPVKCTGGSDIEFCVREVDSQIYLLACRRVGGTTKIDFSGLPAVKPEGEVMYEAPRKVQVSNGKFTDWFAPYDVHIYRFTR